MKINYPRSFCVGVWLLIFSPYTDPLASMNDIPYYRLALLALSLEVDCWQICAFCFCQCVICVIIQRGKFMSTTCLGDYKPRSLHLDCSVIPLGALRPSLQDLWWVWFNVVSDWALFSPFSPSPLTLNLSRSGPGSDTGASSSPPSLGWDTTSDHF